MPYGRGGMLNDQQAWDVALFMNSHERPKDPRAKGSISQTRDQFHDENCLYGRTPEELIALMDSKEKAKADSSVAPIPGKTSSGLTQGVSPATSH